MAESEKWLLTGLKAGYRHIDTAYIYGTEPYVGAALRASGIPREEVFVTTKLAWHHPKYLTRSFDDSLRRLGFDYVDLVQSRWFCVDFCAISCFPRTGSTSSISLRPSSSRVSHRFASSRIQSIVIDGYDAPSGLDQLAKQLKVVESPTFNETWAEFERLHASGRAKAIGVSNFSIKTLEQLFKTAKIVPAVNQVEMHPYLAQTELLEYCRKKGIVITAFSPSGHDQVRSDPTIVALAEKYEVTPTQVILAWHLARGVVAIPKSSNEERQKKNLILPILSVEDVASITALDRNERMVNKIGPDGKVWGWTAEQYGW
ncbi:NADP-dependent oxidoreductase domain-containing protein [Mycena polygramma]|nr:NADP-dependent oxidoreductase domain-containing protein [Mycena polygramma]